MRTTRTPKRSLMSTKAINDLLNKIGIQRNGINRYA